jgi:hypothetical protein
MAVGNCGVNWSTEVWHTFAVVVSVNVAKRRRFTVVVSLAADVSELEQWPAFALMTTQSRVAVEIVQTLVTSISPNAHRICTGTNDTVSLGHTLLAWIVC